MGINFSAENIQRIFGNEAGENETLDRLREYYFKTSVYENVVNDLPIRLLVGHKGIGKSALFKIAKYEHKSRLEVAIDIQPNDVVELGQYETEFNHQIRSWTNGLKFSIVAKVMHQFGMKTIDLKEELSNYFGSISEFIYEKFLEPDSILQNKNEELLSQYLETRKIFVYIDDLDRGWEGNKTDIIRMSALLNSIRDLTTNDQQLKIRLALRSDVYFLIRTSDESTDKIEGAVVWYSWDNHEIYALLAKRIESYFGNHISDEELLGRSQAQLTNTTISKVITPKFNGLGKWANKPIHNVLLSMIRKRPRDMVKLCTLSAQDAYLNKASIISTQNLRNIFEKYSTQRIQDTINEYESELPDIDKLLWNMRPVKFELTAKENYFYTTDELIKKIKNIQQQHNFYFSNRHSPNAKELAAFMYKIDFLTARKDMPNKIVRKYFQESQYLSSTFVDFGFNWEVHPAYRWALEPDDPDRIYNQLDLTTDFE